MLAPLANTTFRRLYAAQVLALFGTGLTTVALALLAYELAGGEAGAVLATALTIKMLTYVAIGPMAGALAGRLPRRLLLVALTLLRAGVVLLLPFVTAVWQIYILVFLLQTASALFTPTLQATIPDILPDERTYTKALSLSRLAYDLENLLSPAFAAALLLVVTFHWLFLGTVIGFVIAALLIALTRLPDVAPHPGDTGLWHRSMLGLRIFARTARLRGLLALNVAVAAGGAMALVNTVVYVRERLALGEAEVAIAMVAFGAGSMIVALTLPGLLRHLPERPTMIAGPFLISAGLAAGLTNPGFHGLLGVWLLLGVGSSLVLTPAGRLLRRSAGEDDRPAVFAAQFSLSHACWLVTYPLAGWVGLYMGIGAVFAGFSALAAVAAVTAWWLWPNEDLVDIEHA
ncbi:MFS transporter [Aquisalimonas asiatica]|uniref:Predicted arabinose efflux permease, MFS family n=1 Tax=Aquisalimonas asiatica TaxID=406100 RepID=A0A1H8T1N2_9GAMM|nr:MFS transporter [Aquisalimonas asiatica]SEO84871.1 Predicted arabinose efflux permease, MFS family [Aquisalimonas asiatica]